MVAWLGISDLRADENDPETNPDGIEGEFQNSTQEQRANNLASVAASQDGSLAYLNALTNKQLLKNLGNYPIPAQKDVCRGHNLHTLHLYLKYELFHPNPCHLLAYPKSRPSIGLQ